MSRPRVVIVGAGFAGYRTARTLARLTRHKADITLLNPTDHFLYLPLLPQVAAGILEPRRVTVSLSGTLPQVRLVLGEADHIDLAAGTVHHTGPEGDGGTLPYDRLVLWCVGVRPDPLAGTLGLPMERGRLLVDPYLRVPGRPEVFACGDAAAVPDLEKPGQYTPMTAQHAWRQGRVAGRNVAASLGIGDRRAYRHKDMGFTVDLGGAQAAANPMGVPLSGPLAGAVTRGYHLAAMPGNRVRVAADWLLDAVLPRQAVQLGLVRSWSVPLDTASPELVRTPGAPNHPGTEGHS